MKNSPPATVAGLKHTNAPYLPEREIFIDNLLVRIHCIIGMIWWTGLAPWEFVWLKRYSSQFKNTSFTEMCGGSEAGSYFKRIDFCITQL